MKKLKFGNVNFDSVETLSAEQKKQIKGGAYGSNGGGGGCIAYCTYYKPAPMGDTTREVR